jgi:tRNA modification GTPase
VVSPATDTIAAIATPPGLGGVGIVRISGPDTPAIARALLGRLPTPRYAELHGFRAADGTLIDQGLALYFAGPASYTGEPVLELQGHGGPVVMDLLLQRVLSLGARPARPGEFSERAYLHDKLDLAQAEAIADLVESGTAQAARAAMRSLQGDFSRRVEALIEALTQVRIYVEAAIDFPEEEIDFLADAALQKMLAAVQADFSDTLARAQQGQLLRDGMTLVIAGRPNAGKSSLMNVLAGSDTAIVTAIPGTTRDVLREHIQIDGLPLHLIDTAGLHASNDPVEQAGMQRTRDMLAQADRVLLVIDDQSGFTAADAAILAELPAGVAHTRVFNKVDLSGRAAGLCNDAAHDSVAISAETHAGVDSLRTHLKDCVGFSEQSDGGFSARRRHLEALQQASQLVTIGIQQLESQRAGELLAEELRQAQQVLGEITGAVSSDDLLGRIFSSFCIGK